MNVLVCSSYRSSWHSVRPEAEIFIEMARQGHQITIATQGDAKYVSRFQDYGIKVIDCFPSKKICLKTIRTLHHELSAKKYDICYAFNSKSIPNAAFACIGTKTKLIAYRGTTGGLYRHDPFAYLTQLHPRVNGIVCVSNAVQQDVVKRVWKNKKNVVSIYKGHQLDWYQAEPTPRDEFGLTDKDIIAVCAAHARPSKGISLLIQTTQFIAAPNFHLILVGNGYEPYYEEIKASPMSKRIHYIGCRDDVPSLMAMADFQVQPSIRGEGLPRTVIEAMANGTPSVVTTTGGSPELVIDGETGYVVEAGNMQAFAKAMNKLIADKAKTERMGKAAQQRLDNEFNAKKTVENHIDFFKRLLEE